MNVACIKVKRMGKHLRQKILTMVESKSDMEGLNETKANAMDGSKPQTLEAFPPTITIERLGENAHSHTLERSREITPSELAPGFN
jgi:hypothetical protein